MKRMPTAKHVYPAAIVEKHHMVHVLTCLQLNAQRSALINGWVTSSHAESRHADSHADILQCS